MNFPKDFTVKDHKIIKNAKQWLLEKDNEVIISVIGGDHALIYGNGVDTFEMWDYREDSPRTYLTEDEINTHLQSNPID